MKTTNKIFLCISIFMIISMLIFPEKVMESGRSALAVCAESIIPSLFPFMIFSGIIVSLGGAEILGKISSRAFGKMFGLSGNCALPVVIGFISGYPVAAASTAELVCMGKISKEEGERLLAFCNNAGPMFILGSVSQMLGVGKESGVILWLSQVITAVFVGILMGRNFSEKYTKPVLSDKQINGDSPVEAVKKSVGSILLVCGFVVAFAVVIAVVECAGASKVLGILPREKQGVAECIFKGLLETTSGCKQAGGLVLPLWQSLPVVSMIIGWSGVSVHLQVAAVIGQSGMSMKYYYLGKILQTAIAPMVTYALLKVVPMPQETAIYVTDTHEVIKLFVNSFMICIIIFVLILSAISVPLKKSLSKEG